MPVIVEDGTGLPTANSLRSVAEIDDYWLLRGGNPEWDVLTGPEKDMGAVLGTDFLCMPQIFNWRGTQHPTGRLSWPRIGASERNGNDIPDNVIPWRVKDALCLIAPRAATAAKAGTTLLPPADRGGAIQSESGAGFSTSYFAGAPSYTVQTDVIALVTSLLRDAVDVGQIELAYVASDNLPADSPNLQTRTFTNPWSPE